MKRYFTTFTAFAMAALCAISTLAAPPERGVRKIARNNKLTDHKWDNADGHDIREVRTDGVYPVLVLLVEFPDQKFKVGNGDPHELVNEMLNGKNFTYNGATGSAWSYFDAVSCGQFSPRFDLYGPVCTSKNEVEYVTTSTTDFYPDPDDPSKQVGVYTPGRMVEEAIKALDDKINFADYDSDGDGYVDFVYIFHAGKGATTGGDSRYVIWPHAFTLTSAIGTPIELDGVKIDRYATSAELGTDNDLSGIGTFCHEFGHVLGFPDFYDTASNKPAANKNVTLGTFDCMDEGNYNNNEHTPPTYSAYERYGLEWMLPVTVNGSADITMLPLTARNFAYKFNTSKPQEYFLMETRAKHLHDYYIPGHGLAVWHIDFDLDVWTGNRPNNIQAHQRVDIVEADGDYLRSTRNGDFFPGAQSICEFMPNANPAFIDWSNKSMGYELTNIIQHPDGTVSFKLNATNGKKMAGADIQAPTPEIYAADQNSFQAHWAEVKGAKGYMISVYDMAKFDGTVITDFVDGYYFKDLGDACSVMVEGLDPDKNYGAYIYAYNDVNASRSALPLQIRTIAAEFEKAQTNLYAHSENGNIEIEWDAVPEADDYNLTIATINPLVIETQDGVNFDDSSLPDGWKAEAKYEQRERYCGEAVPALKMESNSNYIMTPRYENDIENILFTGRVQYNDPYHLDVYSVEADGSMRHIGDYQGLTTEMGLHSLSIPTGVRQVKIVYSMLSTGQYLYMDDVAVNFCALSYDPAVADVTFTEDTKAVVEGLDPSTEYIAFVTPQRNGVDGKRSSIIYFTPASTPSEVEGIEAELTPTDFTITNGMVTMTDPDALFSVYSIDGTCVASSVRGSFRLPAKGIYLLSTQGKAAKIRY